MTYNLIDTHAHLTMPEFDDIEDVLVRAKDASVNTIINVAFDIDSSIKSVELSDRYHNIFAAVGIHPQHADDVNDDAINRLKTLANDKKVVAIGETGLDYFENNVPKDTQKQLFIRHINLAGELNLPLIIHVRDAYDDALEILRKEKTLPIKGVFHCFGESIEYAKKILDLNYYISFTGIITFKNAHNVRETAKYVPLDFIMLETDCPYLAPQIYRGKRNESAYLKFIAEKLAEIKGISFEEVCEGTTKNAIRLFNLKNKSGQKQFPFTSP